MTNWICESCIHSMVVDEELVCMNSAGEYFGEYITPDDGCYDWEGERDVE